MPTEENFRLFDSNLKISNDFLISKFPIVCWFCLRRRLWIGDNEWEPVIDSGNLEDNDKASWGVMMVMHVVEERSLVTTYKLVAKSLMVFDDEKGDEDEIEDDEYFPQQVSTFI